MGKIIDVACQDDNFLNTTRDTSSPWQYTKIKLNIETCHIRFEKDNERV